MEPSRGKTGTSLFSRLCQFLCIGNPGEIARLSARSEIDEYLHRIGEIFGTSRDRPLVVGHRGGDHLRYPKNSKKIRPGYTADVCTLMQNSFETLGLDGVEIDLRIDLSGTVGPEGVIYVTHDEPADKLPSPTIEYLKQNTFEKILSFFIESGYYKTRFLFLEIKCRFARKLDPKGTEKKLIQKTLETIDGCITSAGLSPEECRVIKNHIAFVSFNYRALETLHRYQQSPAHELFLLPATNRILIRLIIFVLRNLKNLSFLSKTLFKEIIDSEALSGIWYDPRAINNSGIIFNEINNIREREKNLPPLKLFLSTYKLDKEQFFKRIERDKNRPGTAAGFVFDIGD
ncbi:MAG: hypothetical protein GY754_07380 [bacterium]|nr:hypothetical protein [bacterium]